MSDNASSETSHPIDAVVTWVDGNDPGYLNKMDPFVRGMQRKKIPGAHSTRFSSINEIKYCVLSILTFAPFIRKLFIVTDGQVPDLNEDIRTYFPERMSSIRIVDHLEIFRDFEDYLPTFNSRSIENMVWRIKGLSENFVYFNDDTFLIKRIRSEDWFIKNRPVLRGKWIPAPGLRMLWNHILHTVNKSLLNNPGFQSRPSFHTGQWLAASLLGFRRRYFFFSHTPHAISRKKVEDFFCNNKELMGKNITFRFRNNDQFNFIALSYHLEILDGNKQIAKPDLSYLQPFNRSKNYINKKLILCGNDPDIKFLCVQSLDMCRKEDQERVFGWMEEILKLQIPARKETSSA